MERERGFALPIVMVLVVLTAALGSTVVQREQTVRRDTQTSTAARQAFHAAEGGIAHARHALSRDTAYAGETLTIGTSEVIVEVTRDGDTGWRVRAAATPGSQVVEARLDATDGLPRIRGWQSTR
ncbi:MAG: hypothetical protein QNJ98_16265 [Planctomycetota bacterium]|nr:hypothetical protein [Planctomycetota bacterium]